MLAQVLISNEKSMSNDVGRARGDEFMGSGVTQAFRNVQRLVVVAQKAAKRRKFP